MKAWKVIGVVALLASVLFGVLVAVHGSKKPEYVAQQVFKEKCGYEMPQEGGLVDVKPIDSYLKLDMGAARVVATGYQKDGSGDIYLKVVSPIKLRFKSNLEINCLNAKPHATGN